MSRRQGRVRCTATCCAARSIAPPSPAPICTTRAASPSTPTCSTRADIIPHQEVEIWNVTNGERFRTYALRGAAGLRRRVHQRRRGPQGAAGRSGDHRHLRLDDRSGGARLGAEAGVRRRAEPAGRTRRRRAAGQADRAPRLRRPAPMRMASGIWDCGRPARSAGGARCARPARGETAASTISG